MRLGMHFPALATIALLTLVTATAANTAGETPPPPPHLLIGPSFVSPVVHPLAAGYVEWVRQAAQTRLGAQKADRLPDVASTPETETQPRQIARAAGRQVTSKEAMAEATRVGAAYLLLVDLRWDTGNITVDFRLYDVAVGEIRGGRTVTARPQTFVAESESALWHSLAWLQLTSKSSEPQPNLSVDELAAATRALEWLDRGNIAKAWQETQGYDSPISTSLRTEAEQRSSAAATPVWERAELLAARGHSDQAWGLISEDARQAYSTRPTEAVPLLLAAGEVQLSRGVLDQSHAYYAKALEIAPKEPQASLGLARVLTAAKRPDDARKAFRHSAHYEPHSAEPLVGWAELETENGAMRAKVLLAAGKRSADRLDVEKAQAQIEWALAADSEYEPMAMEQAGDLYARVGEHEAALASYERARDAGSPTPSRLLGIADSQAALGKTREAEKTYVTLLDGADPEETESREEFSAIYSDAHEELGEIYSASGKHEKAVGHLEEAVALTPTHADPQKALARTLHRRSGPGDLAKAEALYTSSELDAPLTAVDLTELAAIQQAQGDLTGARQSLERAIAERPINIEANEALANVIEAQGDVATANLIRERLAFYGSSKYASLGDTGNINYGDDFGNHLAKGLRELLSSFPLDVKRISLLGVREQVDVELPLRGWIEPRVTDKDQLLGEMNQILQTQYQLVDLGEFVEVMGKELDSVFAFETEESLSRSTITEINQSLTTDGVFVGVLSHRPGNPQAGAGACTASDYYELQLRRLDGQQDRRTRISERTACLEGGTQGAYGRWNLRAGALALGLLLVLCWPLLRGWGTVSVQFQMPPKTQALFSVSLRRRPAKVKDRSKKAKSANSHFFEKQLRTRTLASFSRFTKSLKGDRVTFGWVPARSTPYYVVVRGPLVDLTKDETVGEFLQERTIRVERGKINSMSFDLRTTESAITVNLKNDGQPVDQARIGLQGALKSFRFARNGTGLIYAPLEEHIVQIGADDRVAEIPICLETAAPLTLPVDLSNESILVFKDCPEAVEPYIEGNLRLAAEILETQGQPEAAERVRMSDQRFDEARGSVRPAAPAEPEPAAAPAEPAKEPGSEEFQSVMGENASFVELDGSDD